MKKLKHIFKNIICVFLISAISLPLFCRPAYALESWPEDCYVASEGACLMDADSGTVLFGKNENTAYYPASITKVLTALIVLENCEDLSEKVTFSYDAVHIEEENSTIIGASEGDVLSVLDCLYCLLFQSANEVANALAEHVGAKHPELKENGMTDRDVFVRMMNDKAAELGCTGSHFNNPSGLTDSNHYTTAYDMCLIMAAAIENERFLDIESHTYWTHAPIKRYPDADDPWNTVYPKHLMLKRNSAQYYEGTIAGKTGYTTNAGNTLVTACERNGMTIVTCVLNGHATHYNDTIRLMDFGFDNFTSVNISEYDNINDTIQSDFSIGGVTLIDGYTMGVDPETRVSIPKAGSYVDVEKTLKVGEDDGSSAEMIYTYGDRRVGSAELKLYDIGSSESILKEAETDPLLADILGVKIVTAADTDETAGQNAGNEEQAELKPAENVSGDTAAAAVSDTEVSSGAVTSSETMEAADAAENADASDSGESLEAIGQESDAGELSADGALTKDNKNDETGPSLVSVIIRAVGVLISAAIVFAAGRMFLDGRAAAKRAKRRRRKQSGGISGVSASGIGRTSSGVRNQGISRSRGRARNKRRPRT